MKTGYPCSGLAIRAKEILEEPKRASSRSFQGLSKRFVTIDGNIGARVCINSRPIRDILSVGSTI
jgi:hypothetical protein